MTIGAKLTKKVDNDMLVIDGFKLFYLGAPKQTAIRWNPSPTRSKATTTSMVSV